MSSWWQKAVVYQIYPRSFQDTNGDGIGDLAGIIEHLDYLQQLGIDAIWLSPVYQSPNADNGYDISDYYSIMSEFGSMTDMDNLIIEADRCGIKIIMDLVVNHTSDEHPWFIAAKKSKDDPYRDYYVWRDPVNGGVPNDLPAAWNDSAWEYDKKTGQYYLHLFSVKQPDLNWENPEMRKSIYNMMNFWIDKGIGGFRMDVIDALGKVPDQEIVANGPHLHDYLQEMARNTFGKKDLLTVGETGSVTPEIAKLYSDPARKELSMVFQFEHVFLDHVPGKEKWDLRPLSVPSLKKVMSKWQVELNDVGWNSLYWNNHDQPRMVSRWGDDHQFRVQSAKAFAILLHMMKGTPFIYQGEEIGMTNYPVRNVNELNDIESINYYHEQVDKGEAPEVVLSRINVKGRDNSRTPMQWDATPNAGFTTGIPWLHVNKNYPRINVENSLRDMNSVFYTYQSLIELRKKNPIVVWGEYKLLETVDNVFAYYRTYKDQQWLIVVNLDNHENLFSLKSMPKRVIISNSSRNITQPEEMMLSPFEAFVLEVR